MEVAEGFRNKNGSVFSHGGRHDFLMWPFEMAVASIRIAKWISPAAL